MKLGLVLALTVLVAQGVTASGATEFLVEDRNALYAQCAPHIAPDTLEAIIQTESNFNPLAIAVIPTTKSSTQEVPKPQNAIKTVADASTYLKLLRNKGFSYSAGLGQIFVGNFKDLGLNEETVFDPCTNLKALQTVLQRCYIKALSHTQNQGQALQDALSCYYSGNFKTGYEHGYVAKVVKTGIENQKVPSIVGSFNVNGLNEPKAQVSQAKTQAKAPLVYSVGNNKTQTSKLAPVF